MGGLVSPWNFIANFFSLEISLHLTCFSENLILKVKWSAPYDHFLHPTAIKLANA